PAGDHIAMLPEQPTDAESRPRHLGWIANLSRPPCPTAAACSARTAARQSEFRSGTPNTSSSSDQESSLLGSSAPPARSPESPQKSKSPPPPAETTRAR